MARVTDGRPDSALALLLSRPLAPLDEAVNAVTDALNDAIPWLWWPLAVPPRETIMSPGAHVLYVVHAVAGWAAARAAGLRLGPRLALAGGFAGWALFTGAWDRRALAP